MSWEIIAAAVWKLLKPVLIKAGRAKRDQWAAELKELDNAKSTSTDPDSRTS